MKLLGSSVFILSMVAVALSCFTDEYMTTEDRKIMLKVHNKYRSALAKGEAIMQNGETAPPAKNMYRLIWHCDLEVSAQKWANQCKKNHSEGRQGVGENFFWRGPNVTPVNETFVQAADWWWDELKQNAVYSAQNLTLKLRPDNAVIGHWTQMAWARTVYVGCGIKNCSEEKFTLVVCHYKDRGNKLNAIIYEAGTPCSNCTQYANSTCDVKRQLCVKPPNTIPDTNN